MSLRPALGAAVLIAAAVLPARGHDFWIQPSSWHPALDSRVALELRVGHAGKSEAVARDPRRFETFLLHASGPPDAASARVPVPGLDGRSPAGYVRISEPGLYKAVYVSRPSWIELPADRFEEYLLEEGLEHVVDQRIQLAEGDDVGRELFARCAVSLLDVGDGRAAYGEPLGLELELVPASNPSTVAPGDELELKLLRRGKPVAGALVCAERLPEPGARVLRARTDKEGRTTLRLDDPGAWLVSAVDMQRAPAEVQSREHEPAQWISHWASLTFELPAPADHH